MRFLPLFASLILAFGASASPVPDPLEALKRAGPAAGTSTQTLVNTLNAVGAKATFFVTGTLYGCIYNQAAAVKSAYASGHQIASHTRTHPAKLASLSAADLTTQMRKLERLALVNIIGVRPTYMRPPYLATGGNVQSVMKSVPGLPRHHPTTSTREIGTGTRSRRARRGLQRPHPLVMATFPLMHEVYQTAVTQLVQWLVNWAKTNNLKLVTVADCLGDAGGAYTDGTGGGGGGAQYARRQRLSFNPRTPSILYPTPFSVANGPH
ncbi:hypothetical protein H2203_002896 [Taxawa tesnikishii (nom. ined.)]|nr:hypothetical protein H2203_002896 [Dothideales sp. JES 119]